MAARDGSLADGAESAAILPQRGWPPGIAERGRRRRGSRPAADALLGGRGRSRPALLGFAQPASLRSKERRLMQHSLRQRFTLLAATAAALTGLLLAPASPAQAVTKLTDSRRASQLSASGITADVERRLHQPQRQHCTSYEQIDQSTVTGIKTYKGVSGCAVNITGVHRDRPRRRAPTATGTATRSTSPARRAIDNYITSHYTCIGLARRRLPAVPTAPPATSTSTRASHWRHHATTRCGAERHAAA